MSPVAAPRMPDPEGLHARLLETLPSAGPSVRRLVEAMLADPAGVSQLTVTELGARTGTSEAAAVRAARALGYPGYPGLRLALAAAGAAPTAQPLSGIAADDIADTTALPQVLELLLAVESEALAATARAVDLGALGALADAIAAAPGVDGYGTGASGLVVGDLEQKLSRIGVRARARTEAHAALTSAVLLDAGDVAVGVSHSGRTRTVVDAVRAAAERGAVTAAVTSDRSSPLAGAADHVLVVAARETAYRAGAMASRTSALLVVDALYVAVVQRLGDRARAALDRTRRAVAR